MSDFCACSQVVIDLDHAKAIAEAAKAAVANKLASEEVQVPANSIEFERAWKRVRGDQAKIENFLCAIPPEMLATYFKSDIDDAILSAIVKCIGKTGSAGAAMCGRN